MEKVAVSKMKKTQEKMLKGRPYRDRMLSVISHLANGQPEYKPTYMEERDPKKIAIIVVSSDKGLCGGCLLYTSPSPRDISGSRMPSSA